MIAQQPGKNIIGEEAHFQVVVIDRAVVVAPRCVDAVFRAFNLRLKILKGLGCFQIRIGLCYCHQPAKGTLQLCLRLLILLKGSRVV